MMELDGQEAKRVVEQRTWNIFWVYTFSMWYVTQTFQRNCTCHMPLCLRKLWKSLAFYGWLKYIRLIFVLLLWSVWERSHCKKNSQVHWIDGYRLLILFLPQVLGKFMEKKKRCRKKIPFQGLSLFFLKLSTNANSSETTSVIYRISFQWTKRVWIHTRIKRIERKKRSRIVFVGQFPTLIFSQSIFCFSSAVSEASIVRNELHTHFITPKIPRN